MLEIRNLHATVEGREILNGIDLTSSARAKSTPSWGRTAPARARWRMSSPGAKAIPSPRAKSMFDGKNLLEMAPETRACEGLFLAFQYPVEIPGVANLYFLKAAVNAVRKYRGEPPVDAMDFWDLVHERMELVKMDESMLKRSVNEGFSGGEKEAQRSVPDGGVATALCGAGRNRFRAGHRRPESGRRWRQRLRGPERGFLVITHYQRLLDYIVPDYVHVLVNGRIVRSGGKELALELEEQGYALYNEEPGRARRAAA
jgi:Fe-S cluster assembly ATP-binding protein